MRALVQRVSGASVKVQVPEHFSRIDKGLVILLGVKGDDTFEDCKYIADKCTNLRVFEDQNDKMNLSLKNIVGEALIISQFTLYGDSRKGNRPSYIEAAEPKLANELYEYFIRLMKENLGVDKVKSGIFGAMMIVEIHNDGPVTILVESKQK